eukprot:447551_1
MLRISALARRSKRPFVPVTRRKSPFEVPRRSFAIESESMEKQLEFGTRHLGRGWSRICPFVMERGRGSTVWGTDGREYLDCTSGIGVASTGHCHPKVVSDVQKQAAEIVHAQVNIGFHKPMLSLVESLLDIVPYDLDTFLFSNSGSEAVENAIKLARVYTGKTNILAVQGGFHGRAIGCLGITTSKVVYRQGFGPLAPGAHYFPHPYARQMPAELRGDENACVQFCVEQLECVLKQQSHPSETAALIIEPVLGEGGYVPAPPAYMEEIRRICTDNGILLIADEVQSGFGRTGLMFAMEHYPNVRPDIMVMAKGLASGYPISAVATRREIADAQTAGTMGGTYVGNAVSCAAAKATIEVIQSENLCKNSAERGEQLRSGLREIASRVPLISDVRGLGLMTAVEFESRGSNGVPPGTAAAISKECVDRGMLILTTSIFEVFRFIPPLVVTEEEIDRILEIFEESVSAVLGK